MRNSQMPIPIAASAGRRTGGVSNSAIGTFTRGPHFGLDVLRRARAPSRRVDRPELVGDLEPGPLLKVAAGVTGLLAQVDAKPGALVHDAVSVRAGGHEPPPLGGRLGRPLEVHAGKVVAAVGLDTQHFARAEGRLDDER